VVGTIEERDSERRWVVQASEISLMDFGDIWRDYAKIVLEEKVEGSEYLLWRKVIPAEKIIKKSSYGRRPIEYEKVLIVGDLNLSADTQFDRRDLEKIIIRDSEIKGDVNFDFTFLHVFDFTGTVFRGNVSFEKAHFVENAQFSNARFFKDVNFKNAKFGSENNLPFLDSTQFEGVIFGGNANFEDTKFVDDMSFSHSRFRVSKDHIVSFYGAEFKRDAHFVDIVSGVEKDINFMSAKFNADANFAFSQFAGNTDFRDAEFKGDANFYGIVLNTKLNKKLQLKGADFNRLRVRSWNSIKDKLDCDGPAYLLLVRSFKMQEQFENADYCYYDYREWRRTVKDISKEKQSNWSKLYDFVSYVSCGYGVRLSFTLAWIFGSILGFASLYRIFYGITKSSPPEITMNTLNNSTLLFSLAPNEISPCFWECLYFSAISLTGSTPVGLSPVGGWKYAVMFESVLGYLLLALFIVILARKLIR
jgi:uncharacterized protein YjbI with pentapeptide repeats